MHSGSELDRLISSDLRRVAETAEEISKDLDIPIQFSSEWLETNNGDLAGMLNSEALLNYPGLFYNSLGMDERYPGGESPRENSRTCSTYIPKSFYSVLRRRMFA